MSLFTKVFSARKVDRGFTLMELIIVIVVIGILASVGVPRYSKVIRSARVAEADSILGAMRRSTIRYHIEYDVYPTVMPGGTNVLDIDIPGYGGYAASKYFAYNAYSSGTVEAKGIAGTLVDEFHVMLTIDGVRTTRQD